MIDPDLLLLQFLIDCEDYFDKYAEEDNPEAYLLRDVQILLERYDPTP